MSVLNNQHMEELETKEIIDKLSNEVIGKKATEISPVLEKIQEKNKPVSKLSSDELKEAKKEISKTEKELLQKKFATVITLDELMSKDFPDPDFLVDGLIPVGLTIIAGAPKLGKSWFALQLSIALASGGYMLGNIKVKQRPTLYIALEDTLRRLNNRVKIVQNGNIETNGNLYLANTWTQGQKGVDALRQFKKLHPEIEVIIIDTFQAFRGRPDGEGYAVDYSDLAALRDCANELNISIILIHHKRKSESMTDPFDEILGSNGICGVVDTAILLKRERRKKEAVLHMTSRDIEEQEIVLQFDGEIGSWSIIGDADFIRLTTERKEIIETLEELGESTTGEVAKYLGKNSKVVSKLLNIIEKDGFIRKAGYGRWVIPLESGGTGGTGGT